MNSGTGHRDKPDHGAEDGDEVAKLKVMCARSMHVAAGTLGQGFAGASGHEVTFDFGTVGGLQAKLDAGETADVVVLSVPAIDKLDKAGALVAGSGRDVARTFVAVCIREGALRPDLTTPEAFKRMLESARAIATSDPAVGGSAGVHLVDVFERMGLTATMKEKGLPQQTGAEVARRVVEGRVDFGLTLSGEVASVPGAAIAGPLPPPYGLETVYCAAVVAGSTQKEAASAFIAALTAPRTRETWTRAGFEVA
jgi:molybdate transport system substrate-binding protein